MIALAATLCWNPEAEHGHKAFNDSLLHAPVGLVSTENRSVELRNLWTGAGLTSFKCEGAAHSPPWNASLSTSGQVLTLLGWGVDKLRTVWEVALPVHRKESVVTINTPNFDYASHADHGGVGLQCSYADGRKLLMFYDGPNVVKLNARSLKVEAHWRLGRAFSSIGMGVYNMWGYSPNWNSLVVGQIKQVMEDQSPSTFFIGKLGRPFREFEGDLAGIVPLNKSDGWTLIFANGDYRTYLPDAGGGYAVRGAKRSLGSRFDPLSGVYDTKLKCLFCRSADGRLASISFRCTDRPVASFANQPRMGATGKLSTFSGSHWLAEHVPQGPVDWFEKLPGGKLIFRFESKLKTGESFIGISD